MATIKAVLSASCGGGDGSDGLSVFATSDAIYRFDPAGWVAAPGLDGEIQTLAFPAGDDGALLAATSSGLWKLPAEAIRGSP